MDKFNLYHIQTMEYLVIKRNEGICLSALLKARRVISSSTRATCKNSAMVPDLTTSAQSSTVSPGNTASIHTTSFSFSTIRDIGFIKLDGVILLGMNYPRHT